MTLQSLGSLPVSGINIGVQLGLPAIGAQITDLQADASAIAAQVAAQAEFSAGKGAITLPSVQTALTGHLASLAAFNPAGLVTGSAQVSLDASAEFALLSAALGIVEPVSVSFSAGLNAGGLATWAYAGTAAGFGERLQTTTTNGFPGVGPDEQVQGLVLMTEDFDTWGQFQAGFNVGRQTERYNGSGGDLQFLGGLAGRNLNTGVAELNGLIELYLAELKAQQSALQAQLDVAVGVNLPDFEAIIDVGANIDVALALENLLTVGVDLAASLDFINARIQFFADLLAKFTFGGGGMTAWAHGGTASSFGAELTVATAGGLPGGNGPNTPAYGMAISTKQPEAWAAFGLIFLTG